MVDYMDHYNSKSTRDKIVLTVQDRYFSESYKSESMLYPLYKKMFERAKLDMNRHIFWGYTYLNGRTDLLKTITDNDFLYMLKIKNEDLVETDYYKFDEFLVLNRIENFDHVEIEYDFDKGTEKNDRLLKEMFDIKRGNVTQCNFHSGTFVLMDKYPIDTEQLKKSS